MTEILDRTSTEIAPMMPLQQMPGIQEMFTQHVVVTAEEVN